MMVEQPNSTAETRGKLQQHWGTATATWWSSIYKAKFTPACSHSLQFTPVYPRLLQFTPVNSSLLTLLHANPALVCTGRTLCNWICNFDRFKDEYDMLIYEIRVEVMLYFTENEHAHQIPISYIFSKSIVTIAKIIEILRQWLYNTCSSAGSVVLE